MYVDIRMNHMPIITSTKGLKGEIRRKKYFFKELVYSIDNLTYDTFLLELQFVSASKIYIVMVKIISRQTIGFSCMTYFP